MGTSDAHLQALFEAAPFGLAILDADLRFERVNPALARMNGLPREEHIGKEVDEILPDLAPEVGEALRSVIRTGQPIVDAVFTGQTPAMPGVERYWTVNYYPLRDAPDRPVTGIALAVDEVSERIAVETQRDRLATRARVLNEFYVAAVRRHTDEREIVDLLARRAAETLDDASVVYLRRDDSLEIAAAWAADRDQRRLIEPAVGSAEPLESVGRDRSVVADRTIVQDGLADGDYDGVVADAAPGIRPFLERYTAHSAVSVPLRALGHPVGAVDVIRVDAARGSFERDEVELVEALALRTSLALENALTRIALAETAARLDAILAESPVATVILDPQMRVQNWNRAAEELFGWSEDDVRGKPLPITPPELAEEFAEIRQRILDGEVVRGLETRRLRRDGSEIAVAVYDAPFRGSDGRPAGIVLRMIDIGERKRLQGELQRTSETLRAILDSSPLAIMGVDLDRRVIYWSQAAEALYGWSAAEVLGGAPPYLPAGEPDTLAAHLPRIAAGESVVVDEVRRLTKSGETIVVRIFGAPLRDASGAVVGMLGIHEDVRERRRLESELFEARKMESVGRLAGGIAHDFNNILTAIIGFADLAIAEPSGADLHASLATIKASAERAAGLTQQLLAFSRRQMLQPQLLDPNEIVLRMESILRRLIGEQIELVIAVTPGVGAIRADRTQVEQVVLNLALNARDAMPGGGRLAIRTEHVRFDETSLSRHFEMTPGDYVLISVTDTGIGMDEQTRAHIFEPFFTTKETGRGTGLGLATTYGIVKQSGGYIWVYSEPGRGTTFKLHFPAISAQVATERPVPPAGGRRSGRILLVEDEPVLRELARQVLTRHGFDVLPAGNAAEALGLAVGDGASIDLLVSDVIMPGISGTELARRLRAGRPDLPVLLMSGYAEEIAAGTMDDAAFLAKPFTPDTLLRSVDAAMDGSRGAARAAGRERRASRDHAGDRAGGRAGGRSEGGQ